MPVHMHDEAEAGHRVSSHPLSAYCLEIKSPTEPKGGCLLARLAGQ